MTNCYEILGVSRGADASEISQAYRRLLQERYQEMGKEADLSLLSQAHKTLTNPVKRRDYDAMLDLLSGQFVVKDPENPTKAEQAYLDGLKAFDLQNYQEAVQYFARAARLDPKQGHFFSQWGLSIGMFPGRLPEAELYCKKAIEIDSDNPVFYFNLGFLYQRHNLSEAAQQSFSKAQEAQLVRQAKHAAQESAVIPADWRGDAGSLLKELDTIEEIMTQSDGEQASVINLPQAEEPAPGNYVGQQPEPVPETDREQIPAKTEQISDHSGIDDLLSELDSLESSMEKVETYNNGKAAAPEEPEDAPLEIVSVKDELIAQIPSGEQQPSAADQSEAPPLEFVTAKDEMIAQMPQGGQQSSPDSRSADANLEMVTIQQEMAPGEQEAPVPEPEHLSETTLDLLKELDSIESMVAGIEQAGAEEQPEVKGSASQTSADDLESEALKLLQELDVPLNEKAPETPEPAPYAPTPAPAEPDKDESTPQPDPEVIRKKMERLNQMEEQMMEELLKLKAEREQLKADLKI